MKANELRIGNLVYCKTNDVDTGARKIEVRDVTYHVIYAMLNDNWAYEPIPLTEEWLLRFGFEKHKVKNYYSKRCGEYEMQVSMNIFSGSLEKDSSWFVSIKIDYGNQPLTLVRQYIHQLQNIYFELSETELAF